MVKLERHSLPLKLAFFCGYPAFSVLFLVLGLGDLWGPWVTIAVSGTFFLFGVLLGKPLSGLLSNSKAPPLFFWSAWLASCFFAVLAGGRNLYAGLAWLFGAILAMLISKPLMKRNFPEKMKHRRNYMCIWIVYILSVAISTSVGLARMNHIISLLPIIIYVIAFGWFAPEVVPRVIPGNRPLLVVGAYFPFIIILYGLNETLNPALSYLTPDSAVVVLVSYIGCYSMLVSRCALEIFRS